MQLIIPFFKEHLTDGPQLAGHATAPASDHLFSRVSAGDNLRPRTVSADPQLRDRSALPPEDEEVRRRRLYLNLGRPRPFYRRRGSDGGRVDPAAAVLEASGGRVDAPAVLEARDGRVDAPAASAVSSGSSTEGHVRSDVRSLQEQGMAFFLSLSRHYIKITTLRQCKCR